MSTLQKSLQLSKENILHFRHEISEFFLLCGSFLPSRIRIPNTDPDPDPLIWLNPDRLLSLCIKECLIFSCGVCWECFCQCEKAGFFSDLRLPSTIGSTVHSDNFFPTAESGGGKGFRLPFYLCSYVNLCFFTLFLLIH